MQRYSIIFLSLVLSFSVMSGAKAETSGATTTTTKTTPTVSDTDITTRKKAADDALTAYKAAKTAEKLAKLQALGDKLIDHRIASLNQFISKLSTRKGLTDASTAALKKSAQDAIDGLTTLKAKIDADTTVEQAKTDVQSIFTTFRIYAVLQPKLHLLTVIDQGQAALDKLNAISPRIQKAIDATSASGSDVTALSAAFADYTVQLTDAKKQLDAAKLEVDKMTASNAEGSKTAATAAREYLKKFRADLVAARSDINTLRDALKTLAPASTSTTPSTGTGAGAANSATNSTSSGNKTTP